MLQSEQMYKIEISKLMKYKNNARTHSKEQIKKLRSSIREFGFINPIIIDNNNMIIAGHGRVEAAQLEGITSVPFVLVEHLSDEQKKAYILADNRLALDAGWDKELLASEIQTLKDHDFDISLTGFDGAEIDELFSQVHNKEVYDDNFDLEGSLNQKTMTKPNDLWILGSHRLFCGDSTLASSYNFMDGVKANLCVTDPPYNVNYEGKAGKIKNDKLDNDDFYTFLKNAFDCIYDNLKPGASIYVFHADMEGLNFRLAFKNAKFKLSSVCHWVKNSIIMGRKDYHWKHESILYGHKNCDCQKLEYESVTSPVLYGWKTPGSHKWQSDRKQSTVWEFDKPQKSDIHPTMKPIPLIAYPIQNSSNINHKVLEPFAGSGSTIIACEQTKRVCYAIELDEKFVDAIVRRFIKFTETSENVYLIRDGKKIKYDEISL